MKLSLSVRVVEKFHSKREAGMPLAGLAALASEHGYRALCMRASQLGTQTDLETVRVERHALRLRGLEVSMVTGDFPIPENSDDEGPLALRNITPYLDLAERLDSDLLRICMKTEEDIPHAQRAADEAGERGMRLAHQCHTRTLFERVNESLEVIGHVGRDNFGLIYEPANLELCHESYGAEIIRAFAPPVHVPPESPDSARRGHGTRLLDRWPCSLRPDSDVGKWGDRIRIDHGDLGTDRIWGVCDGASGVCWSGGGGGGGS